MKKGRGHDDDDDSGNDKYNGRGGTYERRDDRSDRSESGPIRSAGGWILFVRNLHDETDEDTLIDAFSEYGDVSNIAINRDKSDGKSLRYVLIEYEKKEEAIDAIKNMNGKELLERVISVDWAFKNSRR